MSNILVSIFLIASINSIYSSVNLNFGDSLKIKRDSIKGLNLEEVSINSVRADRRTPVSETTLSKSDIERNYTGQEMAILLAKTPGVTWYSDGGNYTGYSYFRLRGIDQTRVNFTLNGVPLNEPEDQGAYFSNYPDFLNSVRSIQVQRGVGISTNGTASFGGSVNMESPSLSDSAYTELNTNFGSYNTYRVSPEFNTGVLSNNWSFYGRYSNVGSNGFRDHSGTNGQSFFLSGGYMGKRGILKFTGFTGTSKNQMAYLAIPDSILKNNYRANLLTKNEKDEFKQSLGILQYILPLGKNSHLSSTFYYNYLEGGYNILFTPDLYNYSVKSDFYGGMLNYQYVKNGLSINAGIHANDYMRSHYSFLLPNENALLYKNKGHKSEYSSFIKLSYAIENLTFFGDLQYRHSQFNYLPDKQSPIVLNSVSWDFINPKGGVSYSINNKQVIYTSVGKTSREPTRNDMFAGYDNVDSLNYLEIGALNRVKPESVTDIELGIKTSFQKMKLDLNVYNMNFKNEIAAIGQLSYIGLPLRKNVKSSYRQGVEMDFKYQPIRKLILMTQANLSSNRIKTYTTDYDSITYSNVHPLLTPEILISQFVIYAVTNKLKIEVNGRYQSMSYLDNTNNSKFVVPSSLIFNTFISFNFYKQHSVDFIVNNVTDQKYYTSGYVQNNQPYYFAMATRNYFITVKLRF
jgi:iron complex outermembrane receptor protein